MAVSCDKKFSSSYLLLSPEDVGFIDLFSILFSTSLKHRKFVDSSEDIEESLNRRWIIFLSIVLQKLILFVAKVLSPFRLGTNIELWLNLVRINGGFRCLLTNFIRGKEVLMPEETSADYESFITNLDRRVDLIEKIRPGDVRYQPQLAMMCAKASYENEAYLKSKVTDHWKMEFLGLYDFWNVYQEKATTQAFLLRDKNLDGETIILAFRGTEPFDADAWCTNIDISWYEIPGMGTVHGGFMKAMGLQKNLGWPKEIPSNTDPTGDNINGDSPRRLPTAYYFLREKLRSLLRYDSCSKYIVTGHSQGAALAILFPAILAMHEEMDLLDRLESVYSFGQPRVGDEEFGKFMEKAMSDHKIAYHRFVYCNDVVPRLPFDDSTFSFKHFGKCRYYDSHYKEQILQEEPNKNYFSLRSVIPMVSNAMYELIRSFTIVPAEGPYFRETMLMRLWRVLGLLIPGLSAHAPMDYDNLIQLGHLFQGNIVPDKKDY